MTDPKIILEVLKWDPTDTGRLLHYHCSQCGAGERWTPTFRDSITKTCTCSGPYVDQHSEHPIKKGGEDQ